MSMLLIPLNLLLKRFLLPPVSFVAGSDAVEWATGVITQQQTQLDAWRDLSVI